MTNKQLATKTYLSFAELRDTVKNIISKHKGLANAIPSTELFKCTYGVHSEDIKNISNKIIMCSRLSSVIKSLRSLEVFVCGLREDNKGYIFYIPVSKNDYKMYKQHNQTRINNLHALTQQCYKFVDKKKYLKLK